MQDEIKQCQNCKKDFVIEQEDFNFYEKIKVPAPTWCPECRFQRRLSFMNVYSLYKRKCDKCNENIISMFHEDKKQIVFCSKCWWGDDWDGTEYGVDYDPNHNFFEQFLELKNKTPHMSVDTLYSSLINTNYTNYSSHLKNCYALFYADFCENSFYSDFLNTLKDSSDCHRARESELCYECTGIYKCFNCISCLECENSFDLFFCKNCSGCNDCFGSINLKNKHYFIFNKQYSKEEYFDFIKNINLFSYSEFSKYKKRAEDFWITQPNREYYGNSLNVNVSGNYVYESKNSHDVYLGTSAENSRFVQFLSVPYTKDCYDYTCWGGNCSLVYETLISGHEASDIKFCIGSYPDSYFNEYSYYSSSCKYIFGCSNLKRKKYCILNKEYSKEEYEKLRTQIISSMNKNPYVDKNGRIYKYGEFFPIEFSPFGYNETMADQYFIKNKKEVLDNGYIWFESIPNKYVNTIKFSELPDKLNDFKNISDEVIKCECGCCYKIIEGELNILKKLNLSIPRKCPECRRKNRFGLVLPPKLYDRECSKCEKEIKTAYSPDRPEIVYCEKCYQQEVY